MISDRKKKNYQLHIKYKSISLGDVIAYNVSKIA